MTPPFQSRRLSRPTAPSCRGGASSLLRLAQVRPSEHGGWMQRAALALAPAQPAPSIITRLLPSREFAR